MAGSAGHQVRHGDVQGDGQLLDVQQGDVPLATFDTTDVCPVEACQTSQRFLGNPLRMADFPKSHPKSSLNIGQNHTLFCVNRQDAQAIDCSFGDRILYVYRLYVTVTYGLHA